MRALLILITMLLFLIAGCWSKNSTSETPENEEEARAFPTAVELIRA